MVPAILPHIHGPCSGQEGRNMRSRIILRITYVENPTEAAKAMAILKRGMIRAIYRLVDETRAETPDS